MHSCHLNIDWTQQKFNKKAQLFGEVTLGKFLFPASRERFWSHEQTSFYSHFNTRPLNYSQTKSSSSNDRFAWTHFSWTVPKPVKCENGLKSSAALLIPRIDLVCANDATDLLRFSGRPKLQHPGRERLFLRRLQPVRKLREHDHHMLHESLLLWQAGGRESGGKIKKAAVVTLWRHPMWCGWFCRVSLFHSDRICALWERTLRLQDKPISHVWIHDQLHP